MRKSIIGVILLAVLITSIFAGCGSSKNETAASDAAPSGVSEAMDDGLYFSTSHNSGYKTEEADGAEFREADSLAGGGSLATDVSNAILAERKIIRSANLTIEVEDFNTALRNIESIILGIGFIQDRSVRSTPVYVDGERVLVRDGTIVLRVDKREFDSVINKLYGIGEVLEDTANGQDVTDQYVDLESRIRLLKIEQAKLEAYLQKLDDIDQIFKAESKLTDILYEIEKLTGNLNKLSSLVDLSTITIYMNEKRPGSETKKDNYGEKLLNSLKDSLLMVVEFLGDMLVFIVAAIPVLIVLGLFALLGVFIFRRIPKKRSKEAALTKSDNDVNNIGQ